MRRTIALLLSVLIALSALFAVVRAMDAVGGMDGMDASCLTHCLDQLSNDLPAAMATVLFVAILAVVATTVPAPSALSFITIPVGTPRDRRRDLYAIKRE